MNPIYRHTSENAFVNNANNIASNVPPTCCSFDNNPTSTNRRSCQSEARHLFDTPDPIDDIVYLNTKVGLNQIKISYTVFHSCNGFIA